MIEAASFKNKRKTPQCCADSRKAASKMMNKKMNEYILSLCRICSLIFISLLYTRKILAVKPQLLANQVVKGSQSGSRARAHRDDDLLVGTVGAIASGKDAV